MVKQFFLLSAFSLVGLVTGTFQLFTVHLQEFCSVSSVPILVVEIRNYILFWLSLLWTEQVQLPQLQSPKSLPLDSLSLSVSSPGNTQVEIQPHQPSSNLRGILIFHNVLVMFLVTQPSIDCLHLPSGLTACLYSTFCFSGPHVLLCETTFYTGSTLPVPGQLLAQR